jgi:hypothetical protein
MSGDVCDASIIKPNRFGIFESRVLLVASVVATGRLSYWTKLAASSSQQQQQQQQQGQTEHRRDYHHDARLTF